MFVKSLLKGQVAVVTGGGTGIGKVIAEDLAAHGSHVVLAARNLERIEEESEKIRRMGVRSLAVSTDVSDESQVKVLFERVDGEFGRLDLLVNNAAANFIRPSLTLTPLRWRKVIDIVLNGSFNCALEAGRRMLRQKSGSIVSLVASYAWTGAPGLAPSASAKAGVVAMTRSLGVEWAPHGVRVNAISPGYIDTLQSRERLWPEEWMREMILDSIPGRRFGSEKDVSNMVLYLASPMGCYINGEVLVIDGGECLGKGATRLIEKAGIIRRSRSVAAPTPLGDNFSAPK
jgi:NAD(P)-dependent dehydrogenase (short-subunit alcohol dehydrogenase family)